MSRNCPPHRFDLDQCIDCRKTHMEVAQESADDELAAPRCGARSTT